MTTLVKRTLSLIGASTLISAPVGYTAEIIPMESFDATTFFDGATAGFDFDGQGGPTQPGFTSVSPSGATAYNAVSNGITMDLTLTNVTNSAHRNRNNAAAGPLVTDFGQWYDNANGAGEAAFSFTGLTPNTDYEISFFVMNLGAGQMTHDFHEGTSSADPLITTFTTSGNPNTPETFSPGITFGINSGPSGQIDVTMVEAGSRLNIDGISITAVAPPLPQIFSEDFEEDSGGFSAVGTPNDWEWGTPNSNNNASLLLTTGNEGSTNCWATSLGDGSGVPSGVINTAANSILRTPDINLTAVTEAELAFAAAVDAQNDDTVEILIREVGTDAQLGSTILPFSTPLTTDWSDFGPFSLAAAAGKNVYLEFRYVGTDDTYIGLYLDDVVVSGK